jgi:hypothetical protein
MLSQAFTTKQKRTAFFWAVTQRVVVNRYRHFGTTYRSQSIGKELPLLPAWEPRRAQFSNPNKSIHISRLKKDNFQNYVPYYRQSSCVCTNTNRWIKSDSHFTRDSSTCLRMQYMSKLNTQNYGQKCLELHSEGLHKSKKNVNTFA